MMKKSLLLIIGSILVIGCLNRPKQQSKTVSIGGVGIASRIDDDSSTQPVSTKYFTTTDSSTIIFESLEHEDDEDGKFFFSYDR